MSIQQEKKINIGLFGFGVVGEALYHVLQKTPSLNASITRVCIKHPEKQRNAPAALFTTDAEELLKDPRINVLVELTDDADASFHIASTGITTGKAVVTANKKMIAGHLEELLALQEKYQTPLLYESACCASIPVIRNLEEYYDNDLLSSISGIVNGSTNYILTKIFKDKIGYNDALKLAQEKGFAESNPSLDVEGVDALNKLTILLAHAYGIVTELQGLVFSGIQHIDPSDAIYAREKNLQIKLVAQATKLQDGTIAAFVLPQFVNEDSQLFYVNDEYNGVVIESSLADKQFFYGKGAGGFPTASAVLSDISALRYDYKYEYKKLRYQEPSILSDDYCLRVYLSCSQLTQVPHELFEKIEEWSSNEQRCYVTGIIHVSKLKQEWWKQNGISLIALPDVIEESLFARKQQDVLGFVEYA